MAFLPYSPLGGGILGGKPLENAQGRRAFLRENAAVEAFSTFCRELGHEPAQVALAWVARQPGVTAPVIGPRSMAQFEESIAALDIALGDDALAKLDELFPGPGGAAPEAYAW
jgi:aryl-alcohol dehydrogenase-like predicted oxidoreductase